MVTKGTLRPLVSETMIILFSIWKQVSKNDEATHFSNQAMTGGLQTLPVTNPFHTINVLLAQYLKYGPDHMTYGADHITNGQL